MCRGRRGSTALEFALLFPFLTTIVLGIAEYAWAQTQRVQLVEAAREVGWAVAVEGISNADAQTLAIDLLERHGFDCTIGYHNCYASVSTTGGTPTTVELTLTIDYVPLQALVPAPNHLGYVYTMGIPE